MDSARDADYGNYEIPGRQGGQGGHGLSGCTIFCRFDVDFYVSGTFSKWIYVLKRKTGNQDQSDDSGSSEESSSDDSAVYAKRYDKGLQEGFAKIKRNEPDRYPLDTKLKPFIPDYIPAIGEVDAFLKIPRPDKKEDNLGYFLLFKT